MILGRPTNQILAVFTAGVNLIVLVLAALVPPIIIPAVIVGAANIFFAAVIALVAGQAPTVPAGSTVNVVTPEGQANKTVTVA